MSDYYCLMKFAESIIFRSTSPILTVETMQCHQIKLRVFRKIAASLSAAVITGTCVHLNGSFSV